MADINFTGNKTLATINKEWLAKFPFMYIRFVGHGDWKVTHAAVRTKKDAADLSTNAGMNVGTFETRHNDAYGAQVELCYVKNGRMYRSLGEQNALTLNEFNAFAKEKGGVEIMTAHPEWFETSIKEIEKHDTIEIQKPNDAKVDILFVIDNSGSMASYQKSLSDNIDKFISIFANAQIIPDFKIGVITTDNPVPITFNKTSMLNDKTTFISSVKKAIMAGTSGSATEKPLEMATIAVKSNFSRPDAMLFVNIISDENDDSPDSTIHYIEQMKLEKGSKKVTINAIYSSSGAKHFEAAKITGGLCATINSEYASLLTNIGTTVMDLIKTYPLSETPRDPLKIEVSVNKKLGANYIYNAKLNSIDFSNPLSPGDILDIVYFIDEKK